MFVSKYRCILLPTFIASFCNCASFFFVIAFRFCVRTFELASACQNTFNPLCVHTFTSNSFLQLLPLHFNLRCRIFVSGLIRSAFFSQKGQQAYFTPLIFLNNACPFHGSGGFIYSEKSIPSDSNADLMLIYLPFYFFYALLVFPLWLPFLSFAAQQI